MNTEKMSHFVQMTANVGVLIGLSLLVYELNQNNQHLQEQAEFVALQTRTQNLRGRAENPEVGRLVYSHLSEQPLTAVDELRREDLIHSTFVMWQWEFERESSGLIMQFDSLEQMASGWRGAIQEWQGENIWRKVKQSFSADFVEFMDTQVLGNPG